MKSLEGLDFAKCRSTGFCGMKVDPVLARNPPPTPWLAKPRWAMPDWPAS